MSAPLPDRPAAAAPTEGIYRFSVAHFLVALVVMLLTVPFIGDSTHGRLIEAGLMSVVLLSAVIAVGGRKRSLITAIALVAPALLTNWVRHIWPEGVAREFNQATAILFIAFVILRLLHFILTAPRVDSEVLCAAVAIYLLLGLMWAFAYALVAKLIPNSFAFSAANESQQSMIGFPSLYFSFCTLTTVGYGDIVPKSNVARLLAMVESTAGVFFATILLARLVALYSSDRPQRAA